MYNQYLESVTRHNNLFSDHGSEVDKLTTILDRSNIISILEGIDMRLPRPLES